MVADQLPLVEARIRLTTLSGTADGKYQLSPTIVVFKPGQRTASFEVKILNDNILQATRELRLSFDPLTNSTRGEVFVTVISIEDNAAPIAGLEVVGGIRLKEGGDSATLRITLDRTFNQDTTIRIVTAGTATTEDYIININRLRLSAGSTYAETTLEVIDDMQVEADETIILMLVADNDLVIDDRSGAQLTLTIEDDELEISLRAPGQTECRSPSPPESTPNCRIVVTESTGFVTLQLEASRLTAMPLTVTLLYTADVGALTGEFSLADDYARDVHYDHGSYQYYYKTHI